VADGGAANEAQVSVGPSENCHQTRSAGLAPVQLIAVSSSAAVLAQRQNSAFSSGPYAGKSFLHLSSFSNPPSL